MKSHKIKAYDLIDFKNEEKVLYASSITDKQVKRLYISLNGDYEVHNNGEIVTRTSQVFKAVKSYNEL